MKQETALKIINNLEDTYNQIAPKFADTRTRLWPELLYFKQYIKGGQVILDLGCGSGRLLELFKDFKVNYTGIDISEKLIQRARNDWPNRDFRLDSITDLEQLADNQYDLIFMVSVFQHIPSKKMRLTTLSNIKNHLKPDGKILMINWNLYQWRYIQYIIFAAIGKIFWRDKKINNIRIGDLDCGDAFVPFTAVDKKYWRYIHGFTRYGLSRILNRCNLQVERNFKTKFNLVTIITNKI